MLISSAFPTKYLAAADLQGKDVQVTIDRVEMAQFDDGKHKPVIYFVGKQKGVALNKTNANNIAIVHGDDTDQWRGRDVILFTAWVDYQGKSVQAIRVRGLPAPLVTPPAQTAAPSQPALPPEMDDDEIPF